MLRSYLKTGLRHLMRNRVDAIINIGGLALGTAIAILIGLWVHDELTFNQYHKNHSTIAQVYKGTAQKWLPYQLALELKENYHDSFRRIVTTMPPRDFNMLSSGDKVFTMRGQYVEAEFPEMFTLDMVEGTWNGLVDPRSILLSESTAKALFGDGPAIDKLVKIDNRSDVKVTGVYRDLPHDSELNGIKFFAPWNLLLTYEPGIPDYGWDNHFVFVYVELAPGATFEEANARIVESEHKVISNLDYMKEEADRNVPIWLNPMSQWHLHSTFDPGIGAMDGGPVQFVYLVAAIGVFVVILACINFMNLATARSEKRMREVGIRKAIGSLRSQLIGQFFSESFVVVILAFITALQIAALSLPAFNDLSGKQMTMPWTSLQFWIACIGFMSIVATIAGSYPALYLSSFKPSVVLKGQARVGRAASFFRRSLVTVQFTVSIVLIVSTIVVYKQIIFAKDREVGYSRGGLLMVAARPYGERFEIIRQEILNTGLASNVAAAGGRVTSAWSQGRGFEWNSPTSPSPEEMKTTTIGTLDITAPFGKTVGWDIVAGRDFDENIVSDSSAMIINATAAKVMGFVDPIGQVVHWNSKWHAVNKDFRIIGVVSDMVMKSPYDRIQPQVFYLRNFYATMHVRIVEDAKTSDAIAKIGQICKSIAPEAPFDFSFADSEFEQKFAYEERVGKLASVFAVLAIIISCLGLFGMASFMTERRTKEIGIRKVVGASVFRLWKMMSTEFVVLIALSFAIAAPIAWYGLGLWMENFVYRTDVSWQVFAAAGLGSITVTLATVSFQLLKAAHRSPVQSLKTE